MSTIFDRYVKRYDTWYDKNKFVYLSELEALKKVLPREGRGLEIGAGTGRFAAPLGIKFGIDPSKNMLKVARQRGVDARLGYGEYLPYENKSFDYAALIFTLCFVKEPQRVLEEARRVLKKNGKLIIGIIDKESFLGKLYQHKRSAFYKQTTFLSVKEITRLLKETGFNKFSYNQVLFKMPDKIKAIEKPKTGFGKGSFVVIASKKE